MCQCDVRSGRTLQGRCCRFEAPCVIPLVGGDCRAVQVSPHLPQHLPHHHLVSPDGTDTCQDDDHVASVLPIVLLTTFTPSSLTLDDRHLHTPTLTNYARREGACLFAKAISSNCNICTCPQRDRCSFLCFSVSLCHCATSCPHRRRPFVHSSITPTTPGPSPNSAPP